MAGNLQAQAMSPAQVAAPQLSPTTQTPLTRQWIPQAKHGVGLGRFSDTPSRIAVLAVATALAGLIFTAGSFWAIGQRSANDELVREQARQILVAQEAQALLSEADSLATSGYLSGGLQDQVSQNKFRSNIDTAAELITELPRVPVVNDANGRRITDVAGQLATYVRLTALAQANNRQGLPVGSTYQKQASELLRTRILTDLTTVDVQARKSFAQSLNGTVSLTRRMLAFGLPFLIIAGLSMLWLSRRTNRTFNIGLLAAIATLSLALLVALNAGSSSRRDTLSFARGSFKRADLLRQGASAMYEARSSENQALIFRGNRTAYDAAWATSLTKAEFINGALGETRTLTLGVPDVGPYKGAFSDAAATDMSGDWDKARTSVLSGNSRNEFTRAMAQYTAESNKVNGNRFPVFNPNFLRLLTGLAGLVASAFAVAGFQRRLKEYR
jgi:hypothetical protein